MAQIRGGTGRNYLAEVNSDNKLAVAATTRSQLSFISERKEKSFSVYGKRDFTAGSTDEGILYMKYTGDDNLHIEKIIFSSNSADADIEVYFDPTNVTGGQSITPLNLNRGSRITSETTCLNGASDLSASVEVSNELIDIRLSKSTFESTLEGSVILQEGDELYIKGNVENAGEKVRIMVLFFEETAEEGQ